MRDKREFNSILQEIDGRHPSEYAKLTGDFDFSRFVLHNINIPAFPSEPCDSLFVIHVPQLIAGFPESLFDSPVRRTALEDFLARKMDDAIRRVLHADSSSVGRISIARPGRKILPRSSIILVRDYVEARVNIRLPVRGGVISAEDAHAIFFDDLPAIVNASLIHCYLDSGELERFVRVMEDADAIRHELLQRSLVSFVATGARLGRVEPGDAPRPGDPAFSVEESLETTMAGKDGGTIRGLVVPGGVTLILGDAESGRAELINALSAGIYNHVPGDGRELVVSIPDAVQVVADAGRSVQRVDIGPFRSDPGSTGQTELSTDCATSLEAQMAGLVEAIQAGAQTLLIDEASSNPAFLSSDPRIAGLMDPERARMIPLSARARQLAEDLRMNLVVGAYACAADFIPVADTILLMDGYRVRDVTREAKALGIAPRDNVPRARFAPSGKSSRWIIPSSIDPSWGIEDAVIRADDKGSLRFGRFTVPLTGIPQLADEHQVLAIGLLLYNAKLHHLDDSRTVEELLDLLDQDLRMEGMDAITRDLRGDLARPRRFEIAAVLNRLGSLRIAPGEGSPGSAG